MSAANPKISLKPGSSVTLPPSGSPVEIEAAACPDDDDDPWVWPRSVIALRIDDEIVGAIATEDVAEDAVEGLDEVASEAEGLPELDLEVSGVLRLPDTEALESRLRGRQARIVVGPGRLDLDAYRPLLEAAEAAGEDVQFMIVPSRDG